MAALSERARSGRRALSSRSDGRVMQSGACAVSRDDGACDGGPAPTSVDALARPRLRQRPHASALSTASATPLSQRHARSRRDFGGPSKRSGGGPERRRQRASSPRRAQSGTHVPRRRARASHMSRLHKQAEEDRGTNVSTTFALTVLATGARPPHTHGARITKSRRDRARMSTSARAAVVPAAVD